MPVSKRIIRLGWLVVSALIVVLCGASVVQAVMTVAGGGQVEWAVDDLQGPPRPTQNPASMYVALGTSPLFIQAPSTTVAPVVVLSDDEVEPDTRLELILVGVVRNADGTGFAVIENKRSRGQDTYQVGEEILPSVVLESIKETRVVLSNKGKREALHMLVEGGEESGSGSRPVVRRPVSRSRNTTQPQAASAAIRKINDNLRVITRDMFEREYGSNAVQTITSASTEPRYVGDQPSGLILRDLGRGNLLEDLGFQKDDVIVAVQGRRTNEPVDLEAIGEHLYSSSDIRVQIVRDNLPRTLIFKVR